MTTVRMMVVALVLGMGFGPPVRAAILVTVLEEPIVMFSDLFSIRYPIDVNGDSGVDFTFSASVSSNGIRTERANRIIFQPDPPPNLGGPVAPLEEGFFIGPELVAADFRWRSSNLLGGYVEPDEIAFASLVICVSTGCGSAWPPGVSTRGFIGFEFEIDEALHYGWFDVSLSGSSTGASLYGWAYNSIPGEPIRAGEVPEPATVALLSGLAALLFAGVVRWQRRRDA